MKKLILLLIISFPLLFSCGSEEKKNTASEIKCKKCQAADRSGGNCVKYSQKEFMSLYNNNKNLVLPNADLTGINFKSIEMENCQFSNSYFDSCHYITAFNSEFEFCSFYNSMISKFENSNLRGTDFILSGISDRFKFNNCDLRISSFVCGKFSRLIKILDLRNSNITSCDFAGSSFEDCNLSGLDFTENTFNYIWPDGSISGVKFKNCNLSNCNFASTDLSESSFINCQLNNTNFAGANLSGCQYDKNILNGLNLDKSIGFHSDSIK